MFIKRGNCLYFFSVTQFHMNLDVSSWSQQDCGHILSSVYGIKIYFLLENSDPDTMNSDSCIIIIIISFKCIQLRLPSPL